MRGIVSNQETAKSLELANITMQLIANGESQSTITDNNGLYKFNGLQPGEYLLMVRYVGYETHRDTLTLNRSEPNILVNVRLSRSEGELDEVIVSGNRDEDLAPGQVKVSPEVFRRAPTPAGSADLAGYLQTQPGVVATGDRGGQVFVR
jgi:iron complex outermembrane receptor protein